MTISGKVSFCIYWISSASAQNNPYPEAAYFRVACFDPLDTTLWDKESWYPKRLQMACPGRAGQLTPHGWTLSWEARGRRGQNKQITLLPSLQSEASFSTVILRNPKYPLNTSAEQTGVSLPGSSWSNGQCGHRAYNPSSFSPVFSSTQDYPSLSPA